MSSVSSRANSRHARLYASLHVPDFPVAVLRRGDRRPGPMAVACGESPNRFVYAADDAARKLGVREGMALATAQARHAAARQALPLRVRDRDEEEEQRVQGLLLKVAESVTPRFENVAPGLISLDFGGLRDPYASAAQLASGAEEFGLQANVGVSGNCFVSLCASRTQTGVTHVYPGQEAGFLHVLPVDTLPLNGRELKTLARWGVRKIGDLARLEEAQLAERFGERGARMARLARGEEGSVLRAYRPPPRLAVSRDFDWEIATLEPLALAMSGMLDRLCRSLRNLDSAAASLTIRLRLAGGGAFERTIDLPYPVSDSYTLLTLARIDLDSNPPGAAVEGVRVSAKSARRRRVQQSLFAPSLPSPENLAVTLARLSGLVGGKRVGAPTVLDTHRPGVAALRAFRPALEGDGTGAVPARPAVAQTAEGTPVVPSPSGRRLSFRCFRPSRPAEVVLDGGRPVRVGAQGASGPVTACAGPWLVSGEWWTSYGWQYQEWDIEVGMRLYRACRERATGEWFLAGEYD